MPGARAGVHAGGGAARFQPLAGPTAIGGPPTHGWLCAPAACACADTVDALAALIPSCSSSCECASRQSAREHDACSANLHMRVLGAHVPAQPGSH